jgi:hypothetical protein
MDIGQFSAGHWLQPHDAATTRYPRTHRHPARTASADGTLAESHWRGGHRRLGEHVPSPRALSLHRRRGFSEDIAGEILVAQLTATNERLPSLLGWDVLKDFDISLNQRAERVLLRRS